MMERRAATRSAVSRGVAIAALVLSLVLTWQGWGAVRRDLVFTAAETEVSFWGRGNYLPTAATRERTGRQLDTLLAVAPDHPEYQMLAASYYAWQAYWSEDPVTEQYFTGLAEQAREKAHQSRPAYLYNDAGQ